MAKKKIHVTPHGKKKWAVKREGKGAGKVTRTKEEAEEAARKSRRSNESIVLHDRKGRIKREYVPNNTDDDEECFITTACITYFNLEDNCYQLSTLRNFRDHYLLKTNDGKHLVKNYYLVAPEIVSLLNNSPNKHQLYQKIFRDINSICICIKNQQKEKAIKAYSNMVIRLLKYFQIG